MWELVLKALSLKQKYVVKMYSFSLKLHCEANGKNEKDTFKYKKDFKVIISSLY